MKKALSLVLSLAIVLSLMSGGNWGLKAQAASNADTTEDNNNDDVFSALGFDTSELPEGYEPDTTSNPYGRDKFTGNQVFEVLLATAGGTKLYGNNDNSVSPSSITNYSTSVSVIPGLASFSGATGDFDGDGLAGEVAYVGFAPATSDPMLNSSLILYVYDSATSAYSAKTNLGNVSPFYTVSNADEMAHAQTYMDAAWQNLLQITTGDYDGDGLSEIAVYVAQSGSARVDIYKYQKAADSADNAWLTIGNWSRVWSYAISSATDKVPNMVSLVSGDFNRDGIDDLGISYGSAVYRVKGYTVEPIPPMDGYDHYVYTGDCIAYSESHARILWGGTSKMLQGNSALDLGAADLARVSLAYGDVDADGTKDLVMAGQRVSDLSKNWTRSIGTYTYDETTGLVLTAKATLNVVDAEFQTTYDSSTGNPSDTVCVSHNGYDTVNLSSPAMRCNAAVVTPNRTGDTYIYVDSALCKYDKSTLSIAYELDDSAKCDGTTDKYLSWAGNQNTAYYDGSIENGADKHMYCEYGAVSGDINGEGNKTLITSYVAPSNTKNQTTKCWNAFKGYSILYGASGLSATTVNTTSGSATRLSSTVVAITMPDTDIDTTLIEYSGIHYLTYTSPKVLAVISAAPYFGDVLDIVGDYSWQNTTSWSSTTGSGFGIHTSESLEIGEKASFKATALSLLLEVELSAGITFEFEQEFTRSTEYTIEYQAIDQEDEVAFYSIPAEWYVYNIYIPDGNGGYTKRVDLISNAFSPCVQVLSLDYYESIRGGL